MARKKKALDRLTQRAMEAERLGMSYGKYIAKYHPRLPSGGEDLQEDIEIPDTPARYRYQQPQQRTPVVGIDVSTGQRRYFGSVGDTQWAGFNPNAVSKCLMGTQMTHQGYSWRKATKDEMEDMP